MKNKYIAPDMDLISYELEDIITTSNPNETPFVPFNPDETPMVPLDI